MDQILAQHSTDNTAQHNTLHHNCIITSHLFLVTKSLPLSPAGDEYKDFKGYDACGHTLRTSVLWSILSNSTLGGTALHKVPNSGCRDKVSTTLYSNWSHQPEGIQSLCPCVCSVCVCGVCFLCVCACVCVWCVFSVCMCVCTYVHTQGIHACLLCVCVCVFACPQLTTGGTAVPQWPTQQSPPQAGSTRRGEKQKAYQALVGRPSSYHC